MKTKFYLKDQNGICRVCGGHGTVYDASASQYSGCDEYMPCFDCGGKVEDEAARIEPLDGLVLAALNLKVLSGKVILVNDAQPK